MGDQGNIIIREDGAPDLFLYSHWSGYKLHIIAQNALALNDRWDDSQYLARIVFCAMLDGNIGTTGFGISTVMGDGDGQCVVIDVSEQKVYTGEGIDGWSFTDYITLNPDTLERNPPRHAHVKAA